MKKPKINNKKILAIVDVSNLLVSELEKIKYEGNSELSLSVQKRVYILIYRKD
jgi:hypothetical protein